MQEQHANDQTRTLSSLDLPPPEAIQQSEQARNNEARLRRLNSDISKLDLQEPSRLSEAEAARQNERMAQQVNEAISSMALPNPERLADAVQEKLGLGSG